MAIFIRRLAKVIGELPVAEGRTAALGQAQTRGFAS
jgi:hypothetical protein